MFDRMLATVVLFRNRPFDFGAMFEFSKFSSVGFLVCLAVLGPRGIVLIILLDSHFGENCLRFFGKTLNICHWRVRQWVIWLALLFPPIVTHRSPGAFKLRCMSTWLLLSMFWSVKKNIKNVSKSTKIQKKWKHISFYIKMPIKLPIHRPKRPHIILINNIGILGEAL